MYPFPDALNAWFSFELWAHQVARITGRLLRWQRVGGRAHVRPQIAHACDTLGHVAQRERARLHRTAFNFVPRARSRYRRAGPRAHGVRRGEGRTVAVATDVDEDAAAAVGLH